MGTSWVRPVTESPTLGGGYMLLRSHALLALWRAYRSEYVELADVRSAFAAAEILHRRTLLAQRQQRRPRSLSSDRVWTDPSTDSVTIAQATCTTDPRKTRSSLKRLARAGTPPEQLFGRCGTALPEPLSGSSDHSDRPVPVPRRIARWLARKGTASSIAVALAHLLRGCFLKSGCVRLGGTCSASWIADTFGIDERTAKTGRRELVEMGWLRAVASPRWHRQRYGASFTLDADWSELPCSRAPNGLAAGDRERSSSPRRASSVRDLPPPRKNKNLPSRGSRNQDRCSGSFSGVNVPTLANVVPEDLNSPDRMASLLQDARRRRLIGESEADRLRFFTTIHHAKRNGTRPCALLAALARRRCWTFGSHSDEELARESLRQLDSPTATTTRATDRVQVTKHIATVSPRPSANPPHDFLRAGEVLLGINLGHARRGVAQHHASRLDSKLLAEVRRGAVSELIR